MDPLNLDCFSQPHWRLIAQGFDTEKWFQHGEGVGTGGILMPKPEDMKVGHRYYRFANSTSDPSSQVGGGWWIDFETFHTIEKYSQNNAMTLTDAARLFLALPCEWTRVDRLVKAILEVPLRAYAGRGKAATAPGEKWTPIQHVQIKQLYVPGLYRPGATSHLYERAFPHPQIEYVASRREV